MKILHLIVSSFLFILFTQICFAETIIEIPPEYERATNLTIEYEGQTITIEDFFQIEDTSKTTIAINEVYNLINEINNVNIPSPEQIFDEQDKRIKIAFLLSEIAFSTEKEVLLEMVDELQSINFPITKDEIDIYLNLESGANIDFFNFSRFPENDSLIEITTNYQDSEYEKEALYRIAVESFPEMGTHYYVGLSDYPYYGRTKKIINAIQAGNLFIEKYSNDQRIELVKTIYEQNIGFYTSDENTFVGDKYYEYILFKIVEPDFQIDYLDFNYDIKEKSVDEIINDPLGFIDLEVGSFNPKTKTYITDDNSQIFTDIPTDHSLYFLTKQANDQGWISGYPDSTFKPDNFVNRAEFAKMLMMAFSKGDGDGTNLSNFPDVYMDQWYIAVLSKAVELGIMEGYPDGYMRPANTINQAEALKMGYETGIDGNLEVFAGDEWFDIYLRYADGNWAGLSFLNGRDNIGSEMTRADCVELILKVIER